MSRSRTSAPNATEIHNAYSLSLLSEYTHTLDSLPLDLSRNFADLRELDAVLSSQMASITNKIRKLTQMIENGKSSKEDRLLLLQDIASEASNLKMGGDDKIRVACQAADNLKLHAAHMKSLLGYLPSFDMSVLNRQTTYPHVATKSFQPPATTEAGRRRRGAGSLLAMATEPSPVKRKRVVREDEIETNVPKAPRKEKVADISVSKPRPAARKKHDRAASPADSYLSVTSHIHPQQNNSRPDTNHNSNRATVNTNNTSKRSKPRHQDPLSYEDGANDQSRSRDIYNAPPNSSSVHPSGVAFGGNPNGARGSYDVAGGLSNGPGDWVGGRPPAGQLEGPGMPVERSSSHPASTIPNPTTLSSTNVGAGMQPVTSADTGDPDGDADDRTYCFCDGISYGEMIACDEATCEREWFHLACIGLTVPPDGTWFCETCNAKRSARRGGRGGKRRAPGGKAGGKTLNGA